MAKQILGRVSIVFKGEYNSTTNYEKLDIVSYNGSSYACLKDCVGIIPTDTTYWQLVAQKGEQGEQGIQGEQGKQGIQGIQGIQGVAGQDGKDGKDGQNGQNGQDGYTPVRGTDYWTAEDIATIQQYIDNQLVPINEELSTLTTVSEVA